MKCSFAILFFFMAISIGCNKPKKKPAFHFETKQAICQSDGGVWDDGQCITQETQCQSDGGVWDDGQCITQETQCQSDGGVWDDGQCITQEIPCYSSGNVWNDGQCITQTHADCLASGNVWNDSQCITQTHADCLASGSVWNDGQCITQTHADCLASGSVWDNDQCIAQTHANCLASGNVWDNDQCITQTHADCLASQGSWDGSTSQCISSAQQRCQSLGYTWTNWKCVVMSGNNKFLENLVAGHTAIIDTITTPENGILIWGGETEHNLPNDQLYNFTFNCKSLYGPDANYVTDFSVNDLPFDCNFDWQIYNYLISDPYLHIRSDQNFMNIYNIALLIQDHFGLNTPKSISTDRTVNSFMERAVSAGVAYDAYQDQIIINVNGSIGFDLDSEHELSFQCDQGVLVYGIPGQDDLGNPPCNNDGMAVLTVDGYFFLRAAPSASAPSDFVTYDTPARISNVKFTPVQ